jgi:Na+/H+ antiporter NhaC
LILTFAWTLKTMTDSLGLKEYIADIVTGFSDGMVAMLPAVVFLIACVMAFATGTSWGTFGVLIPIVVAAYTIPGVGFVEGKEALATILISACMAGAVCGDHCSPISDTTIMASAGAQCNHVNHVSTQLPYAITVAAVSFVSFIIAGFIQNWLICLPISILLMIGTLVVIKAITKKKA